jgi:hypothetical protein
VSVQLDNAVGKIEVAVQAIGAASVVVTFRAHCVRTARALQQWQYEVYDVLFAAWSQWNAEFQASQRQQRAAEVLPGGSNSPSRNAQIVFEELKRQVITWLLQESPFQGRNALLPRQQPVPPAPAPWRDIDLAAALAEAPTIQFLEQASEWGNMAYIFYPYY